MQPLFCAANFPNPLPKNAEDGVFVAGEELSDKPPQIRNSKLGKNAAGFARPVFAVHQFQAFKGFAVVAPDFIYAQAGIDRLARE